MPGSTEKTRTTQLLYVTAGIERASISSKYSRRHVQHELEVLRSGRRRQSLEKPEPMVGQTWTLDEETDVLITDLVVEMKSQAIQRLEVRKRDGAVSNLPLGEFLSRAVYREG
jgi:hypothetical protein